MLTFKENGWNFRAFKILSVLNLLPIKIDLQTGKIQKQSSKIRKLLWKIYFWIGNSHCLYIFWRLIQSTTVEPEKYFRWDHFILHFVCVVYLSFSNFIGYQMFVANPDELVMIFNQVFVEKENPVEKMVDEELESTRENVQAERNGRNSKAGIESASALHGDPNSTEIRPLLSWPPKYSLDELLARVISIVFLLAEILTPMILAVDPSRPQLLYSSLSPECKNVGSFLGLFSIEIISISVSFFTAFFSIVIEVFFFAKCQVELNRLNLQLSVFVEKFQVRSEEDRNIRREIWVLRQLLGEMKELVVFIELFNRCFPFCIFAFKLICLVGSIFFYFFTIRHSQEFPFLGVFSAYMAVSATLIYIILYQNAFSIPEKMEQLKREFLLSCKKTGCNSKSQPANSNLNSFESEMKREVDRIRDVGVKVGSFHTLERESTPIFVSFVVDQVVSLLVTFPH